MIDTVKHRFSDPGTQYYGLVVFYRESEFCLNRRRKEGPMIELTHSTSNRREYSRVDAYIPLEFRLVPPEEYKLVKSRISGDVTLTDFNLMPPLENHPDMEYLDLLNKKLDTIIQMIGLQYEGFHSLSFKYVSISGSGMKFSTQRHFSLGDLLEFKMMLTMHQPAALYVYGEVIKVESQTKGFFVTVCFTMIEDTIRDKIIRFVFETEREMLRERRNTE